MGFQPMRFSTISKSFAHGLEARATVCICSIDGFVVPKIFSFSRRALFNEFRPTS